MNAKLLKALSEHAKMLDCEFTILEAAACPPEVLADLHRAGGKVDEKGQSIGWKISRSKPRRWSNSAHTGSNPGTKARRQGQGWVLPRALSISTGIVCVRGGESWWMPASNPQYREPQTGSRTSFCPPSPQARRPIISGRRSRPRSPSNAPPAQGRDAPAPGWQAPTPRRGGASRKAGPAAPPGCGAGRRLRSNRPPQQAARPGNRSGPAVPPPSGAPATGMPAWLQWLRRGRQRAAEGQPVLRHRPRPGAILPGR